MCPLLMSGMSKTVICRPILVKLPDIEFREVYSVVLETDRHMAKLIGTFMQLFGVNAPGKEISLLV
jgi:hypothetical protein